MRKILGTAVPLLGCVVLLVAQEGFEFEGNNSDLRRVPAQTIQGHDFTFVRLMYNGRIPHYLKNWYTDYPTGDRNLVSVIRRIVDVDIAPENRVISIR
jgi:hypothetical protein